MRSVRPLLVSLSCVALARVAAAQTPPPPTGATPPEPVAQATPAATPSHPSVETPAGTFSMGGYVEAAFSWNFNEPSNGITNFRGFDNRHDTFVISNAVLDGQWSKGPVSGRVALQVGQTPDSYYLAEPALPGTPGAAASSAQTWKYIQQAYVGYNAPVGKGLLVQAGIFLSPIGVEGMAVKDNWNWSRSNLFFGLPFYHMGVRATQTLTDTWSATAGVYNGWNNVVDNNKGKSLSLQLTYTKPNELLFDFLYFGGPERSTGAIEGQVWRSTFDAWAQLHLFDRLWVGAHADLGAEKNKIGWSSWEGGALYAQGRVFRWLYLATRGDWLRESEPMTKSGVAAAQIFFPAPWVGSVTETVDVRPAENLIVRLEGRQDAAGKNVFFQGAVAGDGSAATPYVPNARTQTTVTLGVTTWL